MLPSPREEGVPGGPCRRLSRSCGSCVGADQDGSLRADGRPAGTPAHPRGRRDVRADQRFLGAGRSRRAAGLVRAGQPGRPGLQLGADRRAGEGGRGARADAVPDRLRRRRVWAQKDEPHPTHLGPYPIASWKPDAAQLGLFAHALAAPLRRNARGPSASPVLRGLERAEPEPVPEPAGRGREARRRRGLPRSRQLVRPRRCTRCTRTTWWSRARCPRSAS